MQIGRKRDDFSKRLHEFPLAGGAASRNTRQC
jgi:hypothetical protein